MRSASPESRPWRARWFPPSTGFAGRSSTARPYSATRRSGRSGSAFADAGGAGAVAARRRVGNDRHLELPAIPQCAGDWPGTGGGKRRRLEAFGTGPPHWAETPGKSRGGGHSQGTCLGSLWCGRGRQGAVDRASTGGCSPAGSTADGGSWRRSGPRESPQWRSFPDTIRR